MRARSALFTLFGDVVLSAGGEAWLSALTACMDALGFSPQATRTALHRMTSEGWVQPRRVGRYALYRLTERGVDRLNEAAARIYRLRAAPWDGRWRLLIDPALARDPGLAKTLRWMGFGQLTDQVWISPHEHGARVDAVLGGREATRLVADGGPVEQDARIVRQAWDLEALRRAHAEFLARWRAEHPPSEPRTAFRTRIQLVHHWRTFLFLDPGLPAALLPDDWLGDEAAACFHDLYTAVEDPAWTFYEGLVTAAGDVAPLVRRPHHSPFRRGLAALHSGRRSA